MRLLERLRRTRPGRRPALEPGGGETIPDTARLPTLPAGVDPDALVGDAPTSHRRARLRRRARQLRRVRELLLRDLGGFVYEAQRTAPEDAERHGRLVSSKVERLAAVDAEVRELEARLGEPAGALRLREPGIGGTCPACSALHGSTDRFCSACGAAVAAREALPAAQPALTPAQPAALPEAGPIHIPDAETVPTPVHAPVTRPESAP